MNTESTFAANGSQLIIEPSKLGHSLAELLERTAPGLLRQIAAEIAPATLAQMSSPAESVATLVVAPSDATELGALEPKVRRAPQPFSQQQMGYLKLAEKVVMHALQSDYAVPLATRGISTQKVELLRAGCVLARSIATLRLDQTQESQSETQEARQHKGVLRAALESVQDAAKLKFFALNPRRLEAYFIGHNLFESRALLMQYAQSLVSNASNDNLPAITPEFLATIPNLLAQYLATLNSSEDLRSLSVNTREERDALIRQINVSRREIQLAADSLWPWDAIGTVAAREAFSIPRNKRIGVSSKAAPVQPLVFLRRTRRSDARRKGAPVKVGKAK